MNVHLEPESVKQVLELVPAATGYANSLGLEGVANPADVVALAIQVLHERVFRRAVEIASEAAEREDTQPVH